MQKWAEKTWKKKYYKGGKRIKTQTKLPLKPKFIHYKEKKIPILRFQKAGYEKVLKFLVKGLPWR